MRLFFTALLIVAAGCARGQEPPPAADVWGPVDLDIQRFLQEQPLPGLSVAILKGPDVVFARGYGWADVERRIAVTPETMFPIGSIEKQFTAAAVMRLVEQGRVALSDPITTYLPRLDTAGETITLDDMLHQVSGLQGLSMLEASRQRTGLPDPTPGQWGPVPDIEVGEGFDSSEDIGLFEGQPLSFPPRERWAYCQPNYDLLCYVLAARTGGTYYQAIDAVARRAGVTSFHADWTPRPSGEDPQVAHGYEPDGDGFREAWEPNLGSAWTTAVDLARWGWALDTGHVVSPASFATMTTPARLRDGRSWPYGLGLRLVTFEGRPKFMHTGVILGFYAALARYPQDDLTIALMTNVEFAWLLQGLEAPLARRIFGAAMPEVLDLPLPAAERTRLLGTYDAGPFWFDLVDDDDRLAVIMREPDVVVDGATYFRAPLRFQGEGVFVSDEPPWVRLTAPVGSSPVQEVRIDWDAMPSQAVRRSD